MTILAVVPIALLLSGCATRGETPVTHSEYLDSYLYKIPHDSHWELVGEWEYPGNTGGPLGHYTTSIVKTEGRYVEIYDGTILSGCCFWPTGTLLVRGLQGTFFNPLSDALYSINPDGSLTVIKSSGVAVQAARTPADESFSKNWK